MSEEDKSAGFADLVTTLLDETFEAILDTGIEQNDRHKEIVAAAKLSVDAFADRYISDDDIDAAIATLIGNDSLAQFFQELDNSADPAEQQAAVVRARAAIAEVYAGHAARAQLTRSIQKNQSQKASVFFDQSQWRTYLAPLLAQEQQALFKEVASRPAPRVLVESGRLTARTKIVVTKSATDTTPPSTPGRAPSPRNAGRPSATAFSRPGLKKRKFVTKGVFANKSKQASTSSAATGKHERESEQEIELEFEINFRSEN